MTATKKSIRFLTVLALIFAMVFSIISVPASAAGVETWYGPSVAENQIRVDPYNVTPKKTMGVSGTLKVTGLFTGPEGVNLLITKLTFVLQIRDTAGRILAEDRKTTYNGLAVSLSVEYPVYAGQELQIYCACTKAPSNNDFVPVTFSYSHQIT